MRREEFEWKIPPSAVIRTSSPNCMMSHICKCRKAFHNHVSQPHLFDNQSKVVFNKHRVGFSSPMNFWFPFSQADGHQCLHSWWPFQGIHLCTAPALVRFPFTLYFPLHPSLTMLKTTPIQHAQSSRDVPFCLKTNNLKLLVT